MREFHCVKPVHKYSVPWTSSPPALYFIHPCFLPVFKQCLMSFIMLASYMAYFHPPYPSVSFPFPLPLPAESPTRQ
jgi:hypothetical protein